MQRDGVAFGINNYGSESVGALEKQYNTPKDI